MASEAAALLDSLDDDQRARAVRPFPDADERTRWFYTPTDHGGLPLAAMRPEQHRRTHRLVASGLSTAGYVTAAAIIGLENILDHVEGWSVGFGRERGRDPMLYWVAVFGRPDPDGTWGWRFGGHHVSLNFTIVDGEVVGTTPLFLGADPAAAPLLGPDPHRPLAGAEDLGRELVRSLGDDQRATAVVSPIAPVDLVTANRSTVSEGDRSLPLPRIWRGRLEASLDELMAQTQARAEAVLGVTEAHDELLSFSPVPKGLPVGGLDGDQRQILDALLAVYLDRLPPALADEERRRTVDGLDRTAFLWAGGTEPGQPHYYRLQGPGLLIEYDNTQRDVNHVHTVWRRLDGDFGRDALADHYATDDHH